MIYSEQRRYTVVVPKVRNLGSTHSHPAPCSPADWEASLDLARQRGADATGRAYARSSPEHPAVASPYRLGLQIHMRAEQIREPDIESGTCRERRTPARCDRAVLRPEEGDCGMGVAPAQT